MKNIFSLLLLMVIAQDNFCCTIFSIKVDSTNYFGNNEDWSDPETQIRFYPGNNGKYGYVYLGFTNGWLQGGMNEKGLACDGVAGSQIAGWKSDPNKLNFDGNLCVEILKNCSTVEQVAVYYRRYNEQGLSYARFFYSDSKGTSAVVKWESGQVKVEYKTDKFQVIGYGEAAARQLLKNASRFSISYLSSVLNASHQEGTYPTQYSNLFDLNNGVIYLFNKHDYQKCLVINLKDQLSKGITVYSINDIFIDNSLGSPVNTNNVSSLRNKQVHNQIRVYPNPSYGKVNIMSDSELQTVKITDLHGKVVFECNYRNAKKAEINLSKMPKCIYFLTAGNDSKQFRTKILTTY